MASLTPAQWVRPCCTRKHFSPGSSPPLASTRTHGVLFCIFALHGFVFSWSNSWVMKGKLEPGAPSSPMSYLSWWTPPPLTCIQHYRGLCCELSIDSLQEGGDVVGFSDCASLNTVFNFQNYTTAPVLFWRAAVLVSCQGWYIVTYALGIYHLNLFIAFLSPKVDPSLLDEGRLPEGISMCAYAYLCLTWARMRFYDGSAGCKF